MKIVKADTGRSNLNLRKRNYISEINKSKYLYILMLPAIIYFILFDYSAMYGLTLAFKDYNAKLGIIMSPFAGFKHFESMFSDSYFWYVLINTLKISFGRIFFTFPFPVIIAIAFNELRRARMKKVLQTIYTFPHFLSWVIVSGIIINFLSISGPLNAVFNVFGIDKQVFLGNNSLIIPILYISDVWKTAGWSSIVYLAAITSINTELYEAADIDGANRWNKIWHITLPCIRSTILIMLTLKAGSVLNLGFDQIFNLSNTVVEKTTDILDTYIYRITFKASGDFSYSTAVGMFKSVVNFTMIVILDSISRKLEGTGILSKN